MDGAPFRPGDRVRCLEATAAAMGGLQLRGHVGTVVAAHSWPLQGDKVGEGWVLAVINDDVLPRMRTYHDPGALARA